MLIKEKEGKGKEKTYIHFNGLFSVSPLTPKEEKKREKGGENYSLSLHSPHSMANGPSSKSL